MNFTLRQLQYFEALARTRHFARAAEMVHVSQPALSAQIKEMERRLDARLFDRGRSGVYPTALAGQLLPVARRILAEARQMEEIVAANQGVMRGRLRLGVIPTIAPYVLPALVPLAAGRYPELALEIREGVTDSLVEALSRHEIDLVLAALPVAGAGLETRFLFQDRFIVAKTPGARDMLVGPLKSNDIPADRLLLLAEGHCLRDQALDVCGLERQGRVLDFEATSMATLVQLVAGGLGVTLLPEMAVPFENRGGVLELVEFADPCPARDIGIIWRDGSARHDAFVELGDAICESVPRSPGFDRFRPARP